MLDESLDNFLEAALNAEKYKLYVDIISYLESIEYSTIQDELLNIMFMSIGDDNEKIPKPESTICDEIYGHLRECLISQLSQSGVKASEEVSLKDVYDLAIGLFNIGQHDDLAGIIASASIDGGPLDKLAEVLQMVTAEPADHWAMVLDTVEPEVIKKIIELSTDTINSEYQVMEETAEYLQKLRCYAAYVKERDMTLELFDLVGSVILGSEFEIYINTGVLNEQFEGNDMHRLGLELYGMALMSSDAKGDPVTAIRNVIEKYLGDTIRIVQLNVEVGKINAEFVKYFQTASKTLGE